MSIEVINDADTQLSQSLEQVVLSNLIHNEEFARQVIPFIKSDYFETPHERIISEEILKFYQEYNKSPTPNILAIQIQNNRTNLPTHLIETLEVYLNSLNFVETNKDWLLKNTEKFCKDRAVLKAIVDSFEVIEGKNKELTRDAIPSLLQDALGVCFDTAVGHDYFDDYQKRYEFYHRKEDKIPFDIELLNVITKGGLSKKTLNLILSPPKSGKTMLMCHVAATALLKGKNVLFITLEMAEERIAERIDANLFDLEIDRISELDLQSFSNRVQKLTKKTMGRLFIKEYPPASAHSNHFRALIEELRIKKDFVPDLICVDYLNICASSRLKMGAVNSYQYMKSVSEELRGLGVEYDVPILSASQTNRGGFGNTDLEMNDISESFGIAMSVDIMFALIRTEELDEMNQVMIRQIANRYSDANYYKRFIIGRNASKMKFYDVEDSAQKNLSDTGYTEKSDDSPIFDKSSFGGRSKSVNSSGFKF